MIFITSLVVSTPLAFALETQVVEIKEELLGKNESIGPYLLTASDPNKEMDVSTIMGKQFDDRFRSFGDKKTISYGLNRRWPHWGYFVANNPSRQIQTVFLEFGYSSIDYITLYRVTTEGEILDEQTLGDNLPFSERAIKYRHAVFELDLEPGLSHFLVKINTTSGVVFDLKFHSNESFKNLKLQELVAVGILIGGIITIFFYNFFLFITTGDKNYGRYIIYVASYFFFAINYYGIAPYFMFSTWEKAPFTSWDLYMLIDSITVGAILFTTGFLDLRRESPKLYKVLMGAAVVSGANAVSNLLFLHGEVQQLISLTVLMSFVIGVLLVAVGVRMAIKGYLPAVYYSVAWIFVIAGNCLVIFAANGMLEYNFLTNWSQLIGANAEMLLLSFALGSRINLIKRQKLQAERAMLKEAEEKKRLQAELIANQEENIRTLDAKVKERTQAIREIMTHIKQGIFTFKDDMRISPEFSDYLTELVGKKDLVGINLNDAVFSKSTLSANQISQTMTALDFSFGESKEFGWNANRDSLICEFEIFRDDASRKVIEADWGAIENEDGEVEKILVSLRDVTEIKELKAKADEKEQEAAMLLEMLSNDIDKTQKFLERTLRAWRDVDSELLIYANDPKKSYTNLFRLYHTIKGNARSLGFVKISDAVHDVESLLKKLGSHYNSDKLKRLVELSGQSHTLVNKYHQIFAEKFTRFVSQDVPEKGRLFELFCEKSILPMVARIANEIGKPVPALNISNPNSFLIMNDEIEDVAQNILNHLIRNSLDHGIESSQERKHLGKKPYGEIDISITIDKNKMVHLVYRDDGRGLNLSKIYGMALRRGLITEAATDRDIIEAIFNVGFSTCPKTTLISGRGIGMDAVRHYSQSLGADFTVHLDKNLDELTLKRIKTESDEDIYASFSFHSRVSLKSGAALSSESLDFLVEKSG